MLSVMQRGVQSEEYWTCVCGCGRSTGRRFHPGCDPSFYRRLKRASARGDQLAALLYRYMFKNNRQGTFPGQHRLARQWLAKQGEGDSLTIIPTGMYRHDAA